MTMKRFGLVIAGALILSLTACASPPQAKLLGGTLSLSPGISPTWKGVKSLEDRLTKDIETLKELFDARKHGEMAALLETRRAVITGPDFVKVHGIDSAGFWDKVHGENVTLEIRIANAYISNAGGPHPKLPFDGEDKIKVPEGKRLYNATATIAGEIHVVAKTAAGATLHNDTYPIDFLLQHQWCCLWGEEELCSPPIGAGATSH